MYKKKLAYLLLISALLLLLVIPGTRRSVYRFCGDFFYPFLSMFYNIESYVDKRTDLGKSKIELIEEVTKLRRDNALLAAKASSIDLLRRENIRLHNLLRLKSNPFFEYVFSEIIARDPVQWFQQFTINKGTNEGIKNGSLVIATLNNVIGKKGNLQFAVVGRVSEVSNHSAVVDTIINQDCRLSVILPGNGATGIIKGGGRTKEQLWTTLDYLPRDLEYKAGSIVQTSGLNEFLPPAIKVGRVIGTKEKADVEIYNDLYAKLKVEPLIDFNHLKFVLVLVKND